MTSPPTDLLPVQSPQTGPKHHQYVIKTKAEGTELLGRQIKVQIGGWGRARSRVEGALQAPQEGPLWSGLGGGPSPPSPPTLSVKVPHSTSPHLTSILGQLGPAGTPSGGGPPLQSTHGCQSVSLCLPPSLSGINKPLRPQLLRSGAKNSSRTPALTQGVRELRHQSPLPPTLC